MRLARKEGLIEAAGILEREQARLRRESQINHNNGDGEGYQALEDQAQVLGRMRERIRRRAMRSLEPV